ncbi:hypothetical protein M2354_004604 [Leclercia adecarboxylata]|uniref:Uncharacterized protein n=1 Tax=Enterobacter cloacae TaxID=550 RepID=A0A6S5K5M7_ENTCL|nr:hypothetical protein [Leclercia adecarboxylata]BBS30359.1 hypothetical protein WP5S18C02_05650 [Enterobacter cloacae]BBV84954.1 hypothetical protein STW0522ENT62_04000 [Enterobacter kobei]BEN91132.1 hypothetical protein SMQC07_49310 [Serratia marcescens]BEN96366.1 hypothetical protein SMQC08_49790 [Serratia marcescens]
MTIGLRVHFRHISLLTVYSNVRTWHTVDFTYIDDASGC